MTAVNGPAARASDDDCAGVLKQTQALARALLKILADDNHGGVGSYPLSPAAFHAAKQLHQQLPPLVDTLPPWSGLYDCGRVSPDEALCEWPCKSCTPYTGIGA